MSFDAMKVADLRIVAETFGVDHEEAKTKNELVALLAEEGVSYDMYNSFLNSEKEEVEEEEPVAQVKKEPKKKAKDTVLVKMDRKNPSYQTFGYVFSWDHPFVAIPEDVAQEIFDNEEGFRMATPREVQEFYS
jgi:hypothetical protein